MTSPAERSIDRGPGTYEATGTNEQYLQINLGFIRNHFPSGIPNLRVGDLGCGTGDMSKIIIDLDNPQIPIEIIGIDPNPTSIAAAQRDVHSIRERRVRFFRDVGQNLLTYVEPESLDIVVIGNAIHEIPQEERPAVLAACFAALKPGGKLIANSTFMDEAMPDVKHKLPLGKWKARAKKILNATREGNLPFKSQPVSHYRELLTQAGFVITDADITEVPVDVGVLLLHDIAGYDSFVTGMTGDLVVPEEIIPHGQDYPDGLDYQARLLTVRREALQQAIRDMADEYINDPETTGEFTVPRNWIEIVAKKPLQEAA